MNSNSITYAVDFDRCVSKELASIPAETKHKILARIKKLEEEPYPKGCKKIPVHKICSDSDRVSIESSIW